MQIDSTVLEHGTTADDRSAVWTRAAVQTIGVAFFALATGWAAAVRIPLPFTPVPITLQTLPVLMAGLVMGYELGAASMLIYVLLGCAGLPFFAGMKSGLNVVFGATGGYLVGFIVASWLAGRIAHVRNASWKRTTLALGAGLFVIFALGFTGLMITARLTPADAFAKGVLPFLPGGIVKGVSALILVRASSSWTNRFFRPKS